MFLDAFPASEPAVTTQAPPSVFVLGDFWGLVQQAGPLRWPIFLVLGAGLILVFAKLYELVRDGAVSRPLFQVDLASCDLSRIVGEVSGQDESMLANLQSTMLNVFQTRPGEGMLHDEIHNFVSFQQDQFGVFRRRMEFLSDTAGALGLMGTVWGMFTVFFQGTSEQDVILHPELQQYRTLHLLREALGAGLPKVRRAPLPAHGVGTSSSFGGGDPGGPPARRRSSRGRGGPRLRDRGTVAAPGLPDRHRSTRTARCSPGGCGTGVRWLRTDDGERRAGPGSPCASLTVGGGGISP